MGESEECKALRGQLPAELRERPKNQYQWDLPTAWLLGTQLALSLRDILTSAVTDFDGRDWMSVEGTIDLSRRSPKRLAPGTYGPLLPEDYGPVAPEYWLDFVADTGDSPRLVYQLAYLLQQPRLNVRVREGGNDALLAGGGLPRGGTLIFGGDTAYPVSTRQRLLERVHAPFVWARCDLGAQAAPLGDTVRLLGIPGNHDYYNELSGFERMFHAADRPGEAPLHDETPACEQVALPGYRLAQQASYFAAELPFGWQIWGLDIERDKLRLDDRQRAYFKAIPKAANQIIITSRPMVVNHGLSEHEPEMAKEFDQIELLQPFSKNGELPPGLIRLDLSGDTHLYERYWGTDARTQTVGVGVSVAEPAQAKASARHQGVWTEQGERADVANEAAADATPARVPAPEVPRAVSAPQANYASVVSGLGGAFHHPSQVRFGDLAPRVAWPTSEESARAIGTPLLHPRKVFQAGAAGVAGLVLAALLYWLGAPQWVAQTVERAAPTQTAGREPRAAARLPEGHARDRSPARELGARPDEARALSVGPLDLPFGGCPSSALWGVAWAALLLAGIAVVVGLGVFVIKLGARMTKSIADLDAAKDWWLVLTREITHRRPVSWFLYWLGANRRNAWSALATAPLWVPFLALVVAAITWVHCTGYLAQIADGFGAVNVIAAILVLGLGALGFLLGGQGYAIRARSRGLSTGARPVITYVIEYVVRVVFGVFGAATALLIVWTPYAWTKLAITPGSRALATSFLAYELIRLVFLRNGFSWKQSWGRRVAVVVTWLSIAAFFCAVPWLCMPDGPATPLPWPGILLAALLGGYLTCLWIGWYFFVCLQFDGHGNEAGGAARVVDYAEFLRIKLTRDRAEVWVIAAEAVGDDRPIARLVDHFTVGVTAARTASPPA